MNGKAIILTRNAILFNGKKDITIAIAYMNIERWKLKDNRTKAAPKPIEINLDNFFKR